MLYRAMLHSCTKGKVSEISIAPLIVLMLQHDVNNLPSLLLDPLPIVNVNGHKLDLFIIQLFKKYNNIINTA